MITAKEARSKMEEERTAFVEQQMQTIEQAFQTQLDLHCDKLRKGSDDSMFTARIELEQNLAWENKRSLEDAGYTVNTDNTVEDGKMKIFVLITC